MPKVVNEINWDRALYLRRSTFHGSRLSEEDRAFMERAWKADPERYASLGERVKREYKESLGIVSRAKKEDA